MSMFPDRAAAGRTLADVLVKRQYAKPVVLALPRGGVPVALPIAQALHAPLDLIMVRKIGVPRSPEIAAAAVVDGDQPQIVVNEEVATLAGLGKGDIERLAQVQLAEIGRRREIYLSGREPIGVTGRTAIVVDDGIATGATMRAALRGLRHAHPARLVLAVPVAAADALALLHGVVDDTVCLEAPVRFQAVGAYYADFTQVPDAEVVRLLDEAGRTLAASPGECKLPQKSLPR